MGRVAAWKPEEDAILYANPKKCGSQLLDLLPLRSLEAINQRRKKLGIAQLNPKRKPRILLSEQLGRPLTEESAFHIRADYAAKIKRGYTHEKAVDWLVSANMRYRDVIEDVLTNPKYDADVAACKRKAKL
jgi:hypothetical protein